MAEILPEGYHYRFTGDVENMEDTNKAFGAAVLLAVILIYLILAALYESIIQLSSSWFLCHSPLQVLWWHFI